MKSRIALVEDNAELRELLKEHLTALGLEVDAFETCEAMLKRDCAFYDLVVTDNDLGRGLMTGISLTMELLDRAPYKTIFMYSGTLDAEAKFLHLGGRRFFTKTQVTDLVTAVKFYFSEAV